MATKSVDTKSDDKAENKDSEKKEIKKIGAFPYKREDLVWEAVRRNENYKEFYRKAQEKYPNGKKITSVINKGRNRWLIFLKNALNPDITAKELRQKIIGGADATTVHPYHFMFKEICVHCPIAPIDWDYESTDYEDEYTVNKKAIDIVEEIIEKSKLFIPIWIAPWADEQTILSEVKKITRPLRQMYEQEYQLLVNNKEIASCNATSINAHIETLTKYDEIIKHCGTDGLEIKDGYYVITGLKKKLEPLKDSINIDKYMTAYNEATLLIKNAPYILFKPSRIEKPDEAVEYTAGYQIPMPSYDFENLKFKICYKSV